MSLGKKNRIIFLCGSLEPGRDGVGDYVRRLAVNLNVLNCEVTIVSLFDRGLDTHAHEIQYCENDKINVIRISEKYNNSQRYETLKGIIKSFNPDWISIQFVPYSFNIKGLPFYFARNLKKVIGEAYIHVMFHELWIGVGSGQLSLKEKIIAFIQKRIIVSFIEIMKPALITTSIPLYQQSIKKYNPVLLNLFGNISYKPSDTPFDADYINIIHFGSFSKKYIDFKKQLEAINIIASNKGKKCRFYALGNGGPQKIKALQVAGEIIGVDNIIDKGRMYEHELSAFFYHADIGISRADSVFFGKSGSTISMLEHGLPVVLRGNNKYLVGIHPLSDLLYLSDELKTDIPAKKEVQQIVGYTAVQLVEQFKNVR